LGRVKSGVRSQPSPHHAHPLKTVPQGVHSHGYLENNDNVKSFQHSARITNIGRWLGDFAD
jgi:hypothetical protein